MCGAFEWQRELPKAQSLTLAPAYLVRDASIILAEQIIPGLLQDFLGRPPGLPFGDTPPEIP